MIFKIQNRIFPSNTYLLKNEVGNECVIIDPGLDSEKIHKTILENDLSPIAIVCTHGHFDHIAGVASIKKMFKNVPYYLHRDDLKIAKSANFYLRLAKIKHWIEYVAPDFLFDQKKHDIEISGFNFNILQFPGHSNGSCIIKNGKDIFSGDIIYKKGLGFNNFPGENIQLLKESIRSFIASIEMDSLVHPGHGESETLKNIVTKNFDLINFIRN